MPTLDIFFKKNGLKITPRVEEREKVVITQRVARGKVKVGKKGGTRNVGTIWE